MVVVYLVELVLCVTLDTIVLFELFTRSMFVAVRLFDMDAVASRYTVHYAFESCKRSAVNFKVDVFPSEPAL